MLPTSEEIHWSFLLRKNSRKIVYITELKLPWKTRRTGEALGSVVSGDMVDTCCLQFLSSFCTFTIDVSSSFLLPMAVWEELLEVSAVESATPMLVWPQLWSLK